MANNLKMDKVSSILTLHKAGWSDRQIARELGIHRETVGRRLRLAGVGSKPARVNVVSVDYHRPSFFRKFFL